MTDNEISIKDGKKITEWVKEQKILALKIYQDQWLVYDSYYLRDMENLTRILPPAEYVRNKEKEPTEGQKKRLALLEGIADDPECIGNRERRNEKMKESAKKNHTTVRRLQMLYYRALAGRPLVEERVLPKKEETKDA